MNEWASGDGESRCVPSWHGMGHDGMSPIMGGTCLWAGWLWVEERNDIMSSFHEKGADGLDFHGTGGSLMGKQAEL